jgi:ketol-acid reductoisomerase
MGGPRIINRETRTEMRRILREVRNGSFTKALTADAEAGYPELRDSRARAAAHPIEEARRRVREMLNKPGDR